MLPFTNSWGGSQRMFFLANFLSQNGFDVTVYCVDQGFRDNSKHINFEVKPIAVKNIVTKLDINDVKSQKKSILTFVNVKEKIIKPLVKLIFKRYH